LRGAGAIWSHMISKHILYIYIYIYIYILTGLAGSQGSRAAWVPVQRAAPRAIIQRETWRD
jgi:hypothetical protein